MRWVRLLGLVFCSVGLTGLTACLSNPPDLAPSNDPADYDDEIDPTVEYVVEVSEPRWVVPSSEIPSSVRVQPSNANVAIEFHQDRLFMAWRSAPQHLASEKTQLHVVSTVLPDTGFSLDMPLNWAHEKTVDIQADMREPIFLSHEDELQLLFFEAGTDPFRFEPRRVWRMLRRNLRHFTDRNAERWGSIETFIDRYDVA